MNDESPELLSFNDSMIRKRRRAINRMIEHYIWILISFLVGLRAILLSLRIRSLYHWFFESYTEILATILVFIFPFLFKLIYDKLPFEYIRENKKIKNFHRLDFITDNIVNTTNEIDAKGEASHRIENLVKEDDTKINIHVLESYMKKSEKITSNVYSRSNAYLLIGCLIAFAGVLFFYFQSITLFKDVDKMIDKNLSSWRLFSAYIPRIGTLFFVEAIAFFFLRLHRLSMEEFRYYEAIKRQRENQYAIFKLAEEFKTNADYFDKLVIHCAFNANPNKISQGETNSIIEMEKAIGKDSEIFDKLIELVKLSKK